MHRMAEFFTGVLLTTDADWRGYKTDRPKAAYEHFFPLDRRLFDRTLY